MNTQVKIFGVEPTDANAMALSLHHDQRVILDQVGGFADGVAVKEVGEETFRICKELIDGIVLVFYASAELINQLLPLFMVFHPAFITAKRFSNKIEIKWPSVFETVMLLF